MELNWLEGLLFGLISGLAEFFPVAAPAHEALVSSLLGIPHHPLLRLLVHTAVWEALYLSTHTTVTQLLQERDLTRIPPRRRMRQPDPQLVLDLKLLRTALIPMTIAAAVAFLIRNIPMDLSRIAVFLVLNGVILYIPGHLPAGNKDSRSMTPLDSMLLGISGAAAIFPGISRVGALTTAGIVRGADREHSLRWALHLNLAGLLFVMILDSYALITTGLDGLSLSTVISCVLACAGAFGGAMVGIRCMQFLAVRAGFSGFAYYSWGAALFVFLIYLTI